MAGFVVWFTGLSGAGKSTLATLLAAELTSRGVHVEVLDGDEMRAHLSKGLGFSRVDRDTNVRRIGYVAKLLARAGACAITAAISPYREVRDEQRRAVGRFIEVYCKCSIEALADRDPKGLYRKALKGEIEHFTGVTDPYEEPTNADVVVDTGAMTVDACLAAILEVIEQRGYTAAAEDVATTARGWARRLGPAPSRAENPPIARIEIDDATEALCEAVAFGVLYPLVGPLGEKDATKLAKEGRLESGVAWPLRWTLALPSDGTEPSGGAVIELSARSGRTFLLDVSEVWVGAEGDRNVAGAIQTAPEPRLFEVEQRLAETSFLNAAFVLLRQPLSVEREALLDIALEVRGKLAVIIASSNPAVRASAEHFREMRGLGAALHIEDVPPLPTLDAHHDPLLQVAVLRNLGARSAIVLDDAAGDPVPRDALAHLRASELGLDVIAAGPVERFGDGSLGTRRMRG
ncbi:MAG: adenylyl-sulfate kinase [Polyangiaceae bacterium]|nr:adenylyl-sulfate kinase [Polyangiaceae bacterium]